MNWKYSNFICEICRNGCCSCHKYCYLKSFFGRLCIYSNYIYWNLPFILHCYLNAFDNKICRIRWGFTICFFLNGHAIEMMRIMERYLFADCQRCSNTVRNIRLKHKKSTWQSYLTENIFQNIPKLAYNVDIVMSH